MCVFNAVQHKCIPQAVLGMDVLCQAKSGMGKTAVFVLATLQQLEPVTGQVSVLVMCHTRELAFKISKEYERFSKFMPTVKVAVFFGGLSIKKDEKVLKKDCRHIVVGTPVFQSNPVFICERAFVNLTSTLVDLLFTHTQFKDFQWRILVATNLFGRGMDIEKVNIPTQGMAVSHRELNSNWFLNVARAGGFGTKGLAITFESDESDVRTLNDVQDRYEVNISKKPQEIDISSYSKF
ncbi:hypothetical protein L3Q82_014684 [Scortum barcoo]|uniref:Uncharacterized protein n=1 Tax=Scortum barcoo TaxID=214431 RepID=A0ACB8VRV1_9TELE|nr:hypothetical protein L3Q82_014684 [Scortum barcoo]